MYMTPSNPQQVLPLILCRMQQAFMQQRLQNLTYLPALYPIMLYQIVSGYIQIPYLHWCSFFLHFFHNHAEFFRRLHRLLFITTAQKIRFP